MILDRRDRIVAVFVHYSDAVIFIESNVRHGYLRSDEPGLEEAVDQWLGRPRVGDGEEKDAH